MRATDLAPSAPAPRRGRAVAAALLLAVGAITALLPGAPADAAAPGVLKSQTFRIGPINLAAVGLPGSDENTSDVVPRPPGDVTIKSFKADIQDADGNPIPNSEVHLHHIAIAKLNRTDPACPERHAPGFPGLPVWVILASGAERTQINIGDPFGYEDALPGNWGANWHVMNMGSAPREVYLTYDLTWYEGVDLDGVIPVTPFFMDVAGTCTFAEYNVPGGGGPDSVHQKTETFPMPEDGTIVGTGGHLHEGGIATELHDGDGDLICRAEAIYGSGGHGHSARGAGGTAAVEGMTPCPPMLWPVTAGEVLTLDSYYHNETRVAGAMGINLTFIALGWSPPPDWITTTTSTTSTTSTTTHHHGHDTTTTTEAQATTTTEIDGESAGPVPTTTTDAANVAGNGAESTPCVPPPTTSTTSTSTTTPTTAAPTSSTTSTTHDEHHGHSARAARAITPVLRSSHTGGTHYCPASPASAILGNAAYAG